MENIDFSSSSDGFIPNQGMRQRTGSFTTTTGSVAGTSTTTSHPYLVLAHSSTHSQTTGNVTITLSTCPHWEELYLWDPIAQLHAKSFQKYRLTDGGRSLFMTFATYLVGTFGHIAFMGNALAVRGIVDLILSNSTVASSVSTGGVTDISLQWLEVWNFITMFFLGTSIITGGCMVLSRYRCQPIVFMDEIDEQKALIESAEDDLLDGNSGKSQTGDGASVSDRYSSSDGSSSLSSLGFTVTQTASGGSKVLRRHNSSEKRRTNSGTYSDSTRSKERSRVKTSTANQWLDQNDHKPPKSCMKSSSNVITTDEEGEDGDDDDDEEVDVHLLTDDEPITAPTSSTKVLYDGKPTTVQKSILTTTKTNSLKIKTTLIDKKINKVEFATTPRSSGTNHALLLNSTGKSVHGKGSSLDQSASIRSWIVYLLVVFVFNDTLFNTILSPVTVTALLSPFFKFDIAIRLAHYLIDRLKAKLQAILTLPHPNDTDESKQSQDGQESPLKQSSSSKGTSSSSSTSKVFLSSESLKQHVQTSSPPEYPGNMKKTMSSSPLLSPSSSFKVPQDNDDNGSVVIEDDDNDEEFEGNGESTLLQDSINTGSISGKVLKLLNTPSRALSTLPKVNVNTIHYAIRSIKIWEMIHYYFVLFGNVAYCVYLVMLSQAAGDIQYSNYPTTISNFPSQLSQSTSTCVNSNSNDNTITTVMCISMSLFTISSDMVKQVLLPIPKYGLLCEGLYAGISILPMLFYMILSSLDLIHTLIGLFLIVFANFYLVCHYGLWASMPPLIINAGWGLAAISEYHRQCWKAFVMNKQLIQLNKDNLVLAEEVKNAELRHAIGNVVHDLKTVS